MTLPVLSARLEFSRLGVVLKPNAAIDQRLGVLNPACARLRDGAVATLSSRGGARKYFARRLSANQGTCRRHAGSRTVRLRTSTGGSLRVAHWARRIRLRSPRVTFVAALDRYVMLYVAYGPGGPAVAVAVSDDGLHWRRLGLLRFQQSDASFADKDAAFFPEPVTSPAGVTSLAFYHRPTLQVSVQRSKRGLGVGSLAPGPA